MVLTSGAHPWGSAKLSRTGALLKTRLARNAEHLWVPVLRWAGDSERGRRGWYGTQFPQAQGRLFARDFDRKPPWSGAAVTAREASEQIENPFDRSAHEVRVALAFFST